MPLYLDNQLVVWMHGIFDLIRPSIREHVSGNCCFRFYLCLICVHGPPNRESDLVFVCSWHVTGQMDITCKDDSLRFSVALGCWPKTVRPKKRTKKNLGATENNTIQIKKPRGEYRR